MKASNFKVKFKINIYIYLHLLLSFKVTNDDGKVNYELTEIDKDKEGLHMFQSWKDLISHNSFIDIQDILASSTSSEEVEGATKKKQAV